MIKRLRKIGRIEPATIEKSGKPGKRVLVRKKATGFQESSTDKVDPKFLKFFSGDFKSKSEWDKLLESVEIPGMADASWDRKAAWLYWKATR